MRLCPSKTSKVSLTLNDSRAWERERENIEYCRGQRPGCHVRYNKKSIFGFCQSSWNTDPKTLGISEAILSFVS